MLPRISGTSSDGVITWGHESDVRGIFSTIRPGIDKIIESNGEPFVPEDIYIALITGAADLYVGYRGDEYTGFAVLKPIQFDFESKPVLNIWLGYSVEKASGYLGLEVARTVAKAAGMERIVFSSSQPRFASQYKLITSWYEVS
jgi:hypothetical protein